MTDTQREAFEKWLSENSFVFEYANGDHEPVITITDIRAYWQAALAHSQNEQRELCYRVANRMVHDMDTGKPFFNADDLTEIIDTAITNRKDE